MRATVRSAMTLALVLAAGAWPLAAQREAPIQASIGAGLTAPAGDFNDVYEMGWGAMGAISYRTPVFPLALRLDLALARVKDETPLDLATEMVYGTGNLVYEMTIPQTILRPYLLGGAGVYYFNPRGDDAVGVNSETRFGVNIGAGIELKPRLVGFFAESRLHHVVDPGDDVQFGSLIAGLRFGAF